MKIEGQFRTTFEHIQCPMKHHRSVSIDPSLGIFHHLNLLVAYFRLKNGEETKRGREKKHHDSPSTPAHIIAYASSNDVDASISIACCSTIQWHRRKSNRNKKSNFSLFSIKQIYSILKNLFTSISNQHELFFIDVAMWWPNRLFQYGRKKSQWSSWIDDHIIFTNNRIIHRWIRLILVARKEKEVVSPAVIKCSHLFTILDKVIDGYLLTIRWINILHNEKLEKIQETQRQSVGLTSMISSAWLWISLSSIFGWIEGPRSS